MTNTLTLHYTSTLQTLSSEMKEKVLLMAKCPVVNLYTRKLLSFIWNVSCVLLMWCIDSAGDLIFYLFQLMLINMHNYCSLVFKMSLGKQKVFFFS